MSIDADLTRQPDLIDVPGGPPVRLFQDTPAPSAAFYEVTAYGAIGDGSSSDTRALQAAIDACAEAGGGTVVVPAGRYCSGALWLRDHVTLHLVAGAALVGSGRFDEFPVTACDWAGPAAAPIHAGLINGHGLTNVALTGRGTLDGNGAPWWAAFHAGRLSAERPRLVRLVDCRDVLIDGLTLTRSPMWTLNPVACDNVTITRLTIRNPADSPNTDGINPEACRNVRISDCHIDVGDDCITIKAGTETDGRRRHPACENITVTNCTMLHGHGGVVIGSEITGGVRNVAISNCVFSGTDRGIRIKARRGRGSAVEDVRADNIVMDGVLCPIVVNLFYFHGVQDPSLVTDTGPRPVTAATPAFRRLRFSNITARRVRSAAAYILGLPERAVEDVVLSNVSVYLDEENAVAEPPAMSPVTPDLCRAGMHFRHVDGLRLHAVDVHGATGPAVVLQDVADVRVRDLGGDDGHVIATDCRGLRTDDTVVLVPSPGTPGEG